MDPNEQKELRELGEELAAQEDSPWQPPCIARAFAGANTRREKTEERLCLVLTMQGWIDLDAIRSPFLLEQIPSTADEAIDAWTVLNPGREVPAPEVLVETILGSIRDAFSTVMKMRQSGSFGCSFDSSDSLGFGSWLPLFACLVTQCGLSPAEALAMPVAQTFALIAAMRSNEGWMPQGESYAQRGTRDEAIKRGSELDIHK